MNVLVIGGRFLKVGDGHKFWTLLNRLKDAGHSVKLKECDENDDGNAPEWADVVWADVVIAYSYGTATLWHLMMKHLQDVGAKTWRMLIVIAGVPDFWMGQFYGSVWHAPMFFEQGVSFGVNSVPASCDLKNTDTQTVDFYSYHPPYAAKHLNVKCDSVGVDHGSISETEAILASVVATVPTA